MQPLKIAGIHRSTFNDFPRRVAMVVFARGCNLRCPWCYQSGLRDPRAPSEQQAVDTQACLDFARSRLGQIEGVVLSGGEALLQEGLLGLLAAFKEMGLKTKLDTNGTMPRRLEHALNEGLLDFVSLEVKAPIDNVGAYCFAAGGHIDTRSIEASIRLVADKAPLGEYRTTALPGFHSYDMFKTIAGALPATRPYYLQVFAPNQARSRYWNELPRWNFERLDNVAARLQLELPGRRVFARN